MSSGLTFSGLAADLREKASRLLSDARDQEHSNRVTALLAKAVPDKLLRDRANRFEAYRVEARRFLTASKFGKVEGADELAEWLRQRDAKLIEQFGDVMVDHVEEGRARVVAAKATAAAYLETANTCDPPAQEPPPDAPATE